MSATIWRDAVFWNFKWLDSRLQSTGRILKAQKVVIFLFLLDFDSSLVAVNFIYFRFLTIFQKELFVNDVAALQNVER